MLLIAWLSAVVAATAPGPPPPQLPAVFAPAPEYERLFSGRSEGSRWQVFRTTLPIEAAVGALGLEETATGAWRVLPADPLEAFGRIGSYDPGRLVRLFGADRPRVARGSLRLPDRVRLLTLVSPVPSTDLRTLRPGTLLLLLDRPR